MNIFEISVQDPYLSLILEGKKVIEGRLNRGKFSEMKKGDFVLVGPDKEKFLISNKVAYPSFRKMLEAEGIDQVMPDKNTIEEAEAAYHAFYSKQDEDMYGVVSIHLSRTEG